MSHNYKRVTYNNFMMYMQNKRDIKKFYFSI